MSRAGTRRARLLDGSPGELEGGGDRQAVVDRQPGDVRLRPEPRPLALGERDVAPGVELDRRRRASAPRRGRPTPRGSRSPRTRAGRVEPLAQRARLVDEAGVELGRARGRRCARRARPVRRSSPSQVDRARIAARRRSRRVARRARRSRARARRGAGCAGRRRRRRRARAPAGASTSDARARRRSAPPRGGRAAPGRSAARRCRGRARPRAGRARSRRRGSRRRRARSIPARTSRAWAAKSATLNGWSGSTRSRP